ncbi:MAG: hypothetical protein P0Y48_00410 [Candidatus Microbacterium phytovorans]|uniref:Uncharacterized protein n=1 Tax=Candidatus Microbacterium phytovorans TaxID=3121374 RepID=A0AAJ5W089_9MICO|nr:hypothetical protein [Microbacterium sp.]WEK13706.1 MAG: hypothetical protein P0Y48_00410 [Microbacterium sp.]
MNRMGRRAAAATTAGVCALLVGCSPLPSFDQLEWESRAAAQAIADHLPPGTEVEDRSTGEEGPCGRGTASYTQHWVSYPEPPFDGEEFIATLVRELPDEFDVFETGVTMSDPNLSLSYRGMTIGVIVEDDQGEPIVDILAISRCGLPPEDE